MTVTFVSDTTITIRPSTSDDPDYDIWKRGKLPKEAGHSNKALALEAMKRAMKQAPAKPDALKGKWQLASRRTVRQGLSSVGLIAGIKETGMEALKRVGCSGEGGFRLLLALLVASFLAGCAHRGPGRKLSVDALRTLTLRHMNENAARWVPADHSGGPPFEAKHLKEVGGYAALERGGGGRGTAGGWEMTS